MFFEGNIFFSSSLTFMLLCTQYCTVLYCTVLYWPSCCCVHSTRPAWCAGPLGWRWRWNSSSCLAQTPQSWAWGRRSGMRLWTAWNEGHEDIEDTWRSCEDITNTPLSCRLGTEANDPRSVWEDPASVVLLLVDVVDHVPLHPLILRLFVVLGADDVDGIVLMNGSGFVDVYYMVGVGDEKSKNTTLISREIKEYNSHIKWEI